MLVSTNEVANRLKISNRAVQIKCTRAGLPKIGNQFQITKEVAEKWYGIAEAKTEQNQNRTEQKDKSSHRTNAKTSVNTSLIIIIFSIVVLVLIILLYINLNSQILYYKETIIKNEVISNDKIKVLEKRVNDKNDVIHQQDMEIQSLKYRDSLRVFKKW